MVRRYWVLGMECSLLEIQKLAWFLERAIEAHGLKNPLKLRFQANNYGPYSDRLRHLLNALDGSYLKCEKRINDSNPLDVIWFNDDKKNDVEKYLQQKASAFLPALEQASALIDGFESPFGMELLSTVDWLMSQENISCDTESIMKGINDWPAGPRWAQRKLSIFSDKDIDLAIQRLKQVPLHQ